MIITLVIGLTLALALGMLAQQLRLSPLVGYLVAGMLAAQPWWGHPVDSHIVEEFSHIGVALLLFGVGLHFHFKDLLAVRRVALPGSCICMVLWTGLGAVVYYLLGGAGADWLGGVMFGMCVCVSSTVVLTRVLSENRLLQTPSGHTALGWLVVEDIFTIVMLVLLPVLFGGGTQSVWTALGWMSLKLVAMVFCVAYLGRKVIARVLTYVSRHSSDELFTLAVLVFALGIAVLSAQVFNASMEFGAFLSGMVVGQSKFASRAATDALPMRHAFAVLFFVSVGMGFNISGIVESWPLALGTVLFTLLFKPISAYFVIRMLGRPGSLGVIVGTSLSQIGEFSFILAALAAGTYKLMTPAAANVITGVAIITITLNAALYRFVPGLIRRMEARGIGVVTSAQSDVVAPPTSEVQRVIVVGYGPCGEITSDILRRNNIEVVVIEMNVDTVTRLQKEGVPVIHGDARLRSLLQAAGVEESEAIVVSVTSAPADEIAEAARALNPNIGVIAATHFIRNAQQMRSKGARAVFSGEEELALSMGGYLLHSFGAPDEQVVRERNHMRRKLAGELPYLQE
ncbi:MAG: cation:proton antiporter [Akkermansia sp.]|nr:cation:proton antiporter [Akkermansia sp.]